MIRLTDGDAILASVEPLLEIARVELGVIDARVVCREWRIQTSHCGFHRRISVLNKKGLGLTLEDFVQRYLDVPLQCTDFVIVVSSRCSRFFVASPQVLADILTINRKLR